MPGIEDWIGNPLSIVNNFFVPGSSESCLKDVLNFFKSRITESTLQMIPSINQVSHENLPPNSLVRFRCMIQDMFDPEFYLDAFEVRNCKTQDTQFRSGLFRDIAYCSPDEEVLFDSEKNITKDRITYYCISIPAESSWTKQKSKSDTKLKEPSTSGVPKREKRQHDDDDDMDCESNDVQNASSSADQNVNSGATASTSSNKMFKACNDNKDSRSSLLADLNLPIKGLNNDVACLAKLYDDYSHFQLNDVIEFIGLLSVDPALAQFSSSESNPDMAMDEEEKAHCPPPSLVPRIHVVSAVKRDYINPGVSCTLLKNETSLMKITPSPESLQLTSSAASIREQLHSILSQLFLGDSLAADYMICHLLSSVYLRNETMAIGKFSVNFSNIRESSFPEKSYNIIKQLVTKCYLLSMSLSNMNEMTFTPKKDYTKNKLVSGALQLSKNTHLIVDELALTAGQLDVKGVQNVTALGNMIRWQKIDYDFSFHKMEYNSDIPVMILSEGKSMLPSDVHVPIIPDVLWTKFDQILKGIELYMTPSLLENFRNYITLMKNIKYNVSDDLQKAIQDDFVAMRQLDQSIKVEDLHSLLTLARLVSISEGELDLKKESWEKAKMMESLRKQRLT